MLSASRGKNARKTFSDDWLSIEVLLQFSTRQSSSQPLLINPDGYSDAGTPAMHQFHLLQLVSHALHPPTQQAPLYQTTVPVPQSSATRAFRGRNFFFANDMQQLLFFLHSGF